jgi:protein N-terminal methyltransferase
MSEQKQGPIAPDRLINKFNGRAYWESTEGDVNGMLGGIPAYVGFSSVSRIDLQGSRTFLARFGIGIKNDRRTLSSTLEGGAGLVRFQLHPVNLYSDSMG